MNLNRRTLLTAAGAAAGSALAGCGGGTVEDIDVVPREIGALVVPPAALVPANGQYQVEVIFCTTRSVTVLLGESNLESTAKPVASKGATIGASHQIGFAYFFCNNDYGNTNADFWLEVREKVGGEIQPSLYAGGRIDSSGNTSETPPSTGFIEYREFSNCCTEYEWTFYSRKDNARLAHVRFFPLPKEEWGGFDFGENLIVYGNPTTHDNGGGFTWKLPIQHPTQIQVDTHEAYVLEHDGTMPCTVGLPNRRHSSSHRELVPVFAATKGPFRVMLDRRIRRHLSRFGTALRQINPLNTKDDRDAVHALGNEISRVFGGSKFIDQQNAIRDRLISNLTAEGQNFPSRAFVNFLLDQVLSVGSKEIEDATRALLESYGEPIDYSETDEPTMGGGGFSVSTSLQIGLSCQSLQMEEEDSAYTFGLLSGGGFRVSLGLHKFSWNKKYLDEEGATANYRILNRRGQGFKLGITGIAKGVATKLLGFDGFAYDTEFTVNLTIIPGEGARVDLIQLDPVFDFDNRTRLGNWIQAAYQFAAEKIGPLASSLSTPPELREAPRVMNAETLVQQFMYAMLGFNSQIVWPTMWDVMKQGIGNLAANWQKSQWTRNYAIAEASPLRFMLFNSTANDPSVPFTEGFKTSRDYLAWGPGGKIICGFGIKYERAPNWSLDIPEDIQNIKWFGRNFVVFARIVATVDKYTIMGDSDVLRAAGYPWEH